MTPPKSVFVETNHPNASVYTLDTLDPPPSPDRSDRSSLLTPAVLSPSYGSTFPHSPTATPPRKLLFNAAIKMASIFFVSTFVLGGTLYLALPKLEEVDRPTLKIPKSFTELQALNSLLKKYRDIYPYRILICYVTTYLFLQAFSLPGSMYLSILGGAVWGVTRALPLVCTCVACGATLCYLISAALGPALLTLPKWKARLDKWAVKIQTQKDNVISFLIILRIAPLPPHWVVNVVCPHVGIGIVPFWISTFFGIFGVSVIHTTIGGGLDDMTSADDFHLISWRNFLGLSAVVVGVLIPVGLRYYFKREFASVAHVEPTEELMEAESDDHALTAAPRTAHKFSYRPESIDDGGDFFDEEDEEDDDVILEAGPAIISKQNDDGVPLLH